MLTKLTGAVCTRRKLKSFSGPGTIPNRFEVGVGHFLQEPTSSVGCVSVVRQISSTGIGMSGREDRDPPDGGDDERGGDRGNGGENGLAVAEVHPGNGLLVCWKMWRLCCRRQRPGGDRSPIHAIRKRVNSPEGVWW